MSLKKQLFLYVMLILLFFIVVIGYFIIEQEQEMVQDEIENRGRVLANTLARISQEPLLVYEISTLEQNVDSIKKEKDVISARIINTSERIIADTMRANEGVITGRKSQENKTAQRDILVCKEPIKIQNEIKGYAEVTLSLETMYQKIRSTIKMIILVFFIGFVITMLVVNWMVSYFLKPIISLANSVRKIPSDTIDIEELNKDKPGGELKELYNSIFWMYEEMKIIRKRLIEETQLATIGKLSAYIAHEIRNPLEAISGAVEVVKMNSSTVDKEVYLQIIEEEIHTLNEFLSGFLSLARPQPFKMEEIRIDSIINDILLLLKPMVKKKGVQINTAIEEDIPAIKGNPKDLKRVFTNIIINALESLEAGGLMEIKLFSDQEWVKLLISDNGPGIKDEDMEKIFSPFYSTKRNGTGIGLSISKGIIEAHKGSIEVKSSRFEETEFKIKLPRLKENH